MFEKLLKKFVASFCLISFLFSQFDLSFASVGWNGIGLGGGDFGNASELIPLDAGFVKQTGGNNPSVFIVQDPHGHFEGQKNILRILEALETKRKISKIFLEGGYGLQDVKLLEWFAEKEKNFKAANFLMQTGRIGGAEMFLLRKHLLEKREVPVMGLEDKSLYLEDLSLFRQVARQRDASERFLEGELSHQMSRASRQVNGALYAVMKLWLSFQKSDPDISFHLNTLQTLAKKDLNLDFMDVSNQWQWPMLVRYFALKKRQSRFSANAEKNREKLLAWMLRSGAGFGFKDNRNRRSFWENIYEKRPSLWQRFGQYSDFVQAEGSKILEDEMDAGRLFGEIASLYELLLKNLAKTSFEETAIEEIKTFLTLKKFLTLEVTPEEFEKGTRVLEGADFFSGLPENIQFLFKTARRFYQIARRRDAAFVEKVLRTKTNSGEPVAVIVGGFHTPGLEAALSKKGMNYAVITPRLSETDFHDASRIYYAALLGKAPEFDPRTFSLRYPSMMQPEGGIGEIGNAKVLPPPDASSVRQLGSARSELRANRQKSKEEVRILSESQRSFAKEMHSRLSAVAKDPKSIPGRMGLQDFLKITKLRSSDGSTGEEGIPQGALEIIAGVLSFGSDELFGAGGGKERADIGLRYVSSFFAYFFDKNKVQGAIREIFDDAYALARSRPGTTLTSDEKKILDDLPSFAQQMLSSSSESMDEVEEKLRSAIYTFRLMMLTAANMAVKISRQAEQQSPAPDSKRDGVYTDGKTQEASSFEKALADFEKKHRKKIHKEGVDDFEPILVGYPEDKNAPLPPIDAAQLLAARHAGLTPVLTWPLLLGALSNHGENIRLIEIVFAGNDPTLAPGIRIVFDRPVGALEGGLFDGYPDVTLALLDDSGELPVVAPVDEQTEQLLNRVVTDSDQLKEFTFDESALPATKEQVIKRLRQKILKSQYLIRGGYEKSTHPDAAQRYAQFVSGLNEKKAEDDAAYQWAVYAALAAGVVSPTTYRVPLMEMKPEHEDAVRLCEELGLLGFYIDAIYQSSSGYVQGINALVRFFSGLSSAEKETIRLLGKHGILTPLFRLLFDQVPVDGSSEKEVLARDFPNIADTTRRNMISLFSDSEIRQLVANVETLLTNTSQESSNPKTRAALALEIARLCLPVSSWDWPTVDERLQALITEQFGVNLESLAYRPYVQTFWNAHGSQISPGLFWNALSRPLTENWEEQMKFWASFRKTESLAGEMLNDGPGDSQAARKRSLGFLLNSANRTVTGEFQVMEKFLAFRTEAQAIAREFGEGKPLTEGVQERVNKLILDVKKAIDELGVDSPWKEHVKTFLDRLNAMRGGDQKEAASSSAGQAAVVKETEKGGKEAFLAISGYNEKTLNVIVNFLEEHLNGQIDKKNLEEKIGKFFDYFLSEKTSSADRCLFRTAVQQLFDPRTRVFGNNELLKGEKWRREPGIALRIAANMATMIAAGDASQKPQNLDDWRDLDAVRHGDSDKTHIDACRRELMTGGFLISTSSQLRIGYRSSPGNDSSGQPSEKSPFDLASFRELLNSGFMIDPAVIDPIRTAFSGSDGYAITSVEILKAAENDPRTVPALLITFNKPVAVLGKKQLAIVIGDLSLPSFVDNPEVMIPEDWMTLSEDDLRQKFLAKMETDGKTDFGKGLARLLSDGFVLPRIGTFVRPGYFPNQAKKAARAIGRSEAETWVLETRFRLGLYSSNRHPGWEMPDLEKTRMFEWVRKFASSLGINFYASGGDFSSVGGRFARVPAAFWKDANGVMGLAERKAFRPILQLLYLSKQQEGGSSGGDNWLISEQDFDNAFSKLVESLLAINQAKGFESFLESLNGASPEERAWFSIELGVAILASMGSRHATDKATLEQLVKAAGRVFNVKLDLTNRIPLAAAVPSRTGNITQLNEEKGLLTHLKKLVGVSSHEGNAVSEIKNTCERLQKPDWGLPGKRQGGEKVIESLKGLLSAVTERKRRVAERKFYSVLASLVSTDKAVKSTRHELALTVLGYLTLLRDGNPKFLLHDQGAQDIVIEFIRGNLVEDKPLLPAGFDFDGVVAEGRAQFLNSTRSYSRELLEAIASILDPESFLTAREEREIGKWQEEHLEKLVAAVSGQNSAAFKLFGDAFYDFMRIPRLEEKKLVTSKNQILQRFRDFLSDSSLEFKLKVTVGIAAIMARIITVGEPNVPPASTQPQTAKGSLHELLELPKVQEILGWEFYLKLFRNDIARDLRTWNNGPERRIYSWVYGYAPDSTGKVTMQPADPREQKYISGIPSESAGVLLHELVAAWFVGLSSPINAKAIVTPGSVKSVEIIPSPDGAGDSTSAQGNRRNPPALKVTFTQPVIDPTTGYSVGSITVVLLSQPLPETPSGIEVLEGVVNSVEFSDKALGEFGFGETAPAEEKRAKMEALLMKILSNHVLIRAREVRPQTQSKLVARFIRWCCDSLPPSAQWMFAQSVRLNNFAPHQMGSPVLAFREDNPTAEETAFRVLGTVFNQLGLLTSAEPWMKDAIKDRLHYVLSPEEMTRLLTLAVTGEKAFWPLIGLLATRYPDSTAGTEESKFLIADTEISDFLEKLESRANALNSLFGPLANFPELQNILAVFLTQWDSERNDFSVASEQVKNLLSAATLGHLNFFKGISLKGDSSKNKKDGHQLPTSGIEAEVAVGVALAVARLLVPQDLAEPFNRWASSHYPDALSSFPADSAGSMGADTITSSNKVIASFFGAFGKSLRDLQQKADVSSISLLKLPAGLLADIDKTKRPKGSADPKEVLLAYAQRLREKLIAAQSNDPGKSFYEQLFDLRSRAEKLLNPDSKTPSGLLVEAEDILQKLEELMPGVPTSYVNNVNKFKKFVEGEKEKFQAQVSEEKKAETGVQQQPGVEPVASGQTVPDSNEPSALAETTPADPSADSLSADPGADSGITDGGETGPQDTGTNTSVSDDSATATLPSGDGDADVVDVPTAVDSSISGAETVVGTAGDVPSDEISVKPSETVPSTQTVVGSADVAPTQSSSDSGSPIVSPAQENLTEGIALIEQVVLDLNVLVEGWNTMKENFMSKDAIGEFLRSAMSTLAEAATAVGESLHLKSAITFFRTITTAFERNDFGKVVGRVNSVVELLKTELSSLSERLKAQSTTQALEEAPAAVGASAGSEDSGDGNVAAVSSDNEVETIIAQAKAAVAEGAEIDLSGLQNILGALTSLEDENLVPEALRERFDSVGGVVLAKIEKLEEEENRNASASIQFAYEKAREKLEGINLENESFSAVETARVHRTFTLLTFGANATALPEGADNPILQLWDEAFSDQLADFLRLLLQVSFIVGAADWVSYAQGLLSADSNNPEESLDQAAATETDELLPGVNTAEDAYNKALTSLGWNIDADSSNFLKQEFSKIQGQADDLVRFLHHGLSMENGTATDWFSRAPHNQLRYHLLYAGAVAAASGDALSRAGISDRQELFKLETDLVKGLKTNRLDGKKGTADNKQTGKILEVLSMYAPWLNSNRSEVRFVSLKTKKAVASAMTGGIYGPDASRRENVEVSEVKILAELLVRGGGDVVLPAQFFDGLEPADVQTYFGQIAEAVRLAQPVGTVGRKIILAGSESAELKRIFSSQFPTGFRAIEFVEDSPADSASALGKVARASVSLGAAPGSWVRPDGVAAFLIQGGFLNELVDSEQKLLFLLRLTELQLLAAESAQSLLAAELLKQMNVEFRMLPGGVVELTKPLALISKNLETQLLAALSLTISA